MVIKGQGIRRTRELIEDLDVAIHEFLERNPNTAPSEIRRALRLTERRTVLRRPVIRRMSVIVAVVVALMGIVWLLGLLAANS